MKVSDEMVRIALAVWYQEEEYARALSPSSASMRDMRRVLETVLEGAPDATVAAASEQLEACR